MRGSGSKIKNSGNIYKTIEKDKALLSIRYMVKHSIKPELFQLKQKCNFKNLIYRRFHRVYVGRYFLELFRRCKIFIVINYILLHSAVQ